MDSKSIGIKQREKILQYIINYIQEHGYAPSVREIGEGVGLKSTASVHSHLVRMERDGMIETDVGLGIPRAIRVPGYEFVKDAAEGGFMPEKKVQAPAWIYEAAYFPNEEELFQKIEKALGVRLFTWQKTWILLGVERRTGRTTAECLRALLMPDGKPIDFSYGPSSAKERVYRDTLLELKEKLDEAGIPTNPIARTKDEYNCLLRRWNKNIERSLEQSKTSICPRNLWKQ